MLGIIFWVGGLLLFAVAALLLYQNIIVQLHRAVGQ